MSARRDGSSRPETEERISDGTFRLTLTYCSNCESERTGEGLDLVFARDLRPQQVHFRLEVGLGFEIAAHPGPLDAFHQHLDRVVGKPQELKDVGDPPDLEEAVDGGILLGLVLLGDEHDPLVGLHREIEGANRLLAAHEEGDDDVGEHHHVAQREDRKNQPFARG